MPTVPALRAFEVKATNGAVYYVASHTLIAANLTDRVREGDETLSSGHEGSRWVAENRNLGVREGDETLSSGHYCHCNAGTDG